MTAINVDNILKDLMTSIDDGSAFKEIKKAGKKAKDKAVKQAQPNVFKFHKPSLEPVAIVILYTEVTCLACGCHSHVTGKYPLVEKEDKHGNKHYTKFLTPSNITELPRRKLFLKDTTSVCYRCFEEADLVPVTDDDSAKYIKDLVEVTGKLDDDKDSVVDVVESGVELNADEEKILEDMYAMVGDVDLGESLSEH